MKERKILIKAGLMAGAVFVVSYIISYVSISTGGGDTIIEGGEALGYLTMLIALSAVYFGVRKYRDEQKGGAITWKEAFFSGMIIVLIACIIYVACWMIYYPIAIPDFADIYTASEIELVRQSDLTEAQMDEKIAELNAFNESYKKPYVMVGVTFLEIFPVGLLVAVICAFILRRTNT